VAKDHAGTPVKEGIVHHSDACSQDGFKWSSQRSSDHGVLASVGSVGDAYDNALAESFVDGFKTELIYRRGPWKTTEQVEPSNGRLVQPPAPTRSPRATPVRGVRADERDRNDSIQTVGKKAGAVQTPVHADLSSVT
jgi:transposase InsO family protein